MKLAVAYCRVSTDKEEQKLSIREQKEQWTEFFKENNIKVAKCGMLYKKNGEKEFVSKGLYVDEGISGKSILNRHSFNQMIEDAKLKRFDLIYVEDGSRFSRSTEDALKVIKDLRELNVGIFFRKENINSLDVSADMILTFLFAFYTNENQMKSERMKWAMHRLHERQGWNGAAPFGYDVEKAFLKVNESEAETVRLIYDLYLSQGYGTGKIARYLNSNKILTKTGVKWSQIQVSSILDNKLYNGEQRQHTVVSVDITRHFQKVVPEHEHIVFNIEELKIIDDDTFKSAEIERKRRKEEFKSGRGHSNKYLLSTLIYCSHCGGTFKRKKRHAYTRKDGTSKELGYEWTCGINDMYGADRCGHRNSLIEEKIIEVIKEELRIRKTLDLTDWFNSYCEMTFKFDTDINDFYSNRDAIQNEMRQLRKDMVNGIVDEEIYNDEMLELNKKAGDIKAEISRYERRNSEIEKAKINFKNYKEMLEKLDFENLTNTDLKKIFSKIYLRERVIDNKKTMYLIFTYNFLDTTEEKILEYHNEDIGYGCVVVA